MDKHGEVPVTMRLLPLHQMPLIFAPCTCLIPAPPSLTSMPCMKIQCMGGMIWAAMADRRLWASASCLHESTRLDTTTPLP